MRKSGNHVRITAQLIKVVNDRHLWSETFDRELTDIFAIQQDIANAIVDALRAQLGGAQSVAAVSVHADTENLEAYQHYLKARELFIARKDLPESIRLFEQVTTRGPRLRARLGGPGCRVFRRGELGHHGPRLHAISSEAAKRALELDRDTVNALGGRSAMTSGVCAGRLGPQQFSCWTVQSPPIREMPPRTCGAASTGSTWGSSSAPMPTSIAVWRSNPAT